MYAVYLLQCSDGSYYCGIAKDLKRRFKQHDRGTGSKYVRSRRPFKVLGTNGWFPLTDALKYERQIKKLHRSKKLAALTALPGTAC